MSMLKLAAAAAIAAAGLAAAAAAHPHPDGEGEKVRKFVIIEGDRAGLKDGERLRALRTDRAELLANCVGDKTEIDETSGGAKDKQRTRIVICDKGGADPAARAERLEKAIARINENDELSAEHRERVTTALREAISRMRETN